VSETQALSSLFSFWGGGESSKPAATRKATRPMVKKATPAVAKTAPAKAQAAPSAEATKGEQ
jgi:hypothetical protein